MSSEAALAELAIFLSACPNCGGEITSSRLEKGLPCEKCLPEPADPQTQSIEELHRLVASQLDRLGNLKNYREIVWLEENTRSFVEFFRKLTSKDPWSAQVTWAKRCLRGESFSIIAPTGVGKTTFLSVLAVYVARTGKRVLMVSPTALLARQTASWVKRYASAIDTQIKVAELHGEETDKARREALGMVEEGSANIIVVTAAGLGSLYEKLLKLSFGLILVDDVDALLRKSVNIDRVIRLLGFSEEIQRTATEAILLRMRIARMLAERGGEADGEVESLIRQYRDLRGKIEEYLNGHRGLGQLIVSSATARPRGLKVKVFRELLGFDAGSSTTYIRNILDVEAKLQEDYPTQVVELVKRLGRGGLIFVSKDHGREAAKKIEEALNKAGIRAAQTTSYFHKRVDDFASKKIDVLVGTASYYGKLVRGIDLPQSVRYTIFVGVPKFTSRLEDEELSPLGIIRLLYALSEIIRDPNERQRAFQQAVKLRKMIQNLSPGDLRLIAQAIRENRQLPGYLGRVQEEIGEGRKIFHNQLATPNMLHELEQSDRLIIQESPEGPLVLAPDLKTYIQASGRSSRLLGGKLTRGLSIVLVDNERVMSALQRSMQLSSTGARWYKLEELDLQKVLEQIDRDREAPPEESGGDLVKTALLIVESPNKARTIANFFGRPGRFYYKGRVFYEVMINNTLFTITSSGGHIIDLPTEAKESENYGVPRLNSHFVPKYDFLNRCRSCGAQFTGVRSTCPKCGSEDIQSSMNTVEALRRVAADVPVVYIGSDPDSEGEKIAWDLSMLLSPYTPMIRRVRFHEVTPNAVLDAIANASNIDLNLVAAQIVRRIDDRWVGYGLTKLLTKHKHKLLKRGVERLRVPTGRVQLPTLGYVIKKSEEFKANKVRRFRLTCDVGGGQTLTIPFTVPFQALSAKQARELREKLAGAKITVSEVKLESVEVNPPPPYTTDTILEDASRNFGWSVGEIMRRLQDLFEAGLITYHRTDHTHVSSAGIEIARIYLESTWGKEWRELFQPRRWGEEGAHECIRPTRPLNAEELKKQIDLLEIQGAEQLDYRHLRLYDLIFRRFIASQMVPSRLVRQEATLQAEGLQARLEGYVAIEKDGYTRVNPPKMILRLAQGQTLPVAKVEYKVSSTAPLPTEGETVAYMKEKRIGRPSTYASIIEKLKKHGYIFPTPTNRLVPTSTGKNIYFFLNNELQTLTKVLGEEYTAELQARLQRIEEGKVDYVEVVKQCFEDFQLIKSIARRVN